jgi:ATP-dependent helicase/nuclease subunit B
MSRVRKQKRIFTIPPGAPFLKTFAEALLDGSIVAGYSSALGPLEIADATIYVPTQRSARALAHELAVALGREAALLPKILPLGALDETEEELFFDEAMIEDASLDLPQAIGEVARRLQLSELVLGWSRALRHAIIGVDPQGRRALDERETCLVGTTLSDAWHLSGELAGLIDELIIENIAWKKLDPLVLPEFDSFWRITLDFLDIAITQWPEILGAQDLVDKARRQVALVDAQAARLRAGRLSGPVIAIGSTGSNKATQRLLAAIAAAPRGAVVLPGLDQFLDAESFALIAGDHGRRIDASFTHPQAMLCRLLPVLGVRREDVVALGTPDAALAARAIFVSEALRPAETTDAWGDFPARLEAGKRDAALEDISLIEASDEREEALALAIAMREVLETPGATAALVTPDRNLARRVRSELLRWGIEIDDSGGESLAAAPHGVLARLITSCAASKMAPQDLAALLAHPLVRLGYSRQSLDRLAATFEIGLLRSPGFPAFLTQDDLADPGGLIAAARSVACEPHAYPARQRISAAEWESIAELLRRLGKAFAPLLAISGEASLGALIGAHRAVLVAVMAGEDDVPDGEDASALDSLLDELGTRHCGVLRCDVETYKHFFAAVSREVVLKGQRNAHPRLKILGLLEARLMPADVMLLAGLDEATWPPPAKADVFLNRPMRAELGLTPPERKLGQTAHDFAMAFGAPRVILSRAKKRDGSPTVPSRLLQRMAALGGAAFDLCALRGGFYLRLARAIDAPAAAAMPAARPLPRPALALRPVSLSVTRIETLRRDPYAIYAELILNLAELDPLGRAPGFAEFGSAVHAALETFVKENPSGPLPERARDILDALLRTELASQLDDPDFAAVQWPRLRRMIDFYLGFETGRRDHIQKIMTEIAGRHDIMLADGSRFTLRARADRIELNHDGSVTLVDYKTGTPPGPDEILVGFAPQLTLEAAMAARGAFGFTARINQIDGLYLKLGGAEGGKARPIAFKAGTFADVAERHFAGLVDLLTQFRDEATPYPPRPFPKFAKKYNAYDHLARVKEWSQGGAGEGPE